MYYVNAFVYENSHDVHVTINMPFIAFFSLCVCACMYVCIYLSRPIMKNFLLYGFLIEFYTLDSTINNRACIFVVSYHCMLRFQSLYKACIIM